MTLYIRSIARKVIDSIITLLLTLDLMGIKPIRTATSSNDNTGKNILKKRVMNISGILLYKSPK
jgi:hypothetical protein